MVRRFAPNDQAQPGMNRWAVASRKQSGRRTTEISQAAGGKEQMDITECGQGINRDHDEREAQAALAASNCSGNSASPRPTVDRDRECWVQANIRTAIRMALAVKEQKCTRADQDVFECALDGIVNGAAVEIIHILGMEPEWVNLRKPPVVSSNVFGPGEPMGKPSSPNDQAQRPDQ